MRGSSAGASAQSFSTILNILGYSQHPRETGRDNTRSVGDQSPSEAAAGCQAKYPKASKWYQTLMFRLLSHSLGAEAETKCVLNGTEFPHMGNRLEL